MQSAGFPPAGEPPAARNNAPVADIPGVQLRLNKALEANNIKLGDL